MRPMKFAPTSAALLEQLRAAAHSPEIVDGAELDCRGCGARWRIWPRREGGVALDRGVKPCPRPASGKDARRLAGVRGGAA